MSIGEISEGVQRVLRLDTMTRAQNVTDIIDNKINDEAMFEAIAVTAAGASLSISFKTPSGTKRAHMRIHLLGESKCHAIVTEGGTWTTNTGTVYAPINQFGGSSEASMLLEDKTATPAFTAGGVLTGVTSPTGGTAVKTLYSFAAGSVESEYKLVLKPDTTYNIIATSDDGSKGMRLIAAWYEHTDEV